MEAVMMNNALRIVLAVLAGATVLAAAKRADLGNRLDAVAG
jgi:hypothetical protein